MSRRKKIVPRKSRRSRAVPPKQHAKIALPAKALENATERLRAIRQRLQNIAGSAESDPDIQLAALLLNLTPPATSQHSGGPASDESLLGFVDNVRNTSLQHWLQLSDLAASLISKRDTNSGAARELKEHAAIAEANIDASLQELIDHATELGGWDCLFPGGDSATPPRHSTKRSVPNTTTRVRKEVPGLAR